IQRRWCWRQRAALALGAAFVLIALALLPSHGRKSQAQTLPPPAPGTWSTASAMTASRVGQTATLLANGKLLVTGGNGLASAELYDPGSGTWSPAGSMANGRSYHTATLLPNGKVF